MNCQFLAKRMQGSPATKHWAMSGFDNCETTHYYYYFFLLYYNCLFEVEVDISSERDIAVDLWL